MEPSSTPAPSENSLIEQRREKLAKLRGKGIDPFQNKFTPDSQCNEARSKFDTGEVPEGARFSVAGRITAHRDMGKSIFGRLADLSGRAQVYFKKDALGEDAFALVKRDTHVGDFVSVSGPVFRTKTGEPTVAVETVTMLAKAIRPMPEKWHGLQDTDGGRGRVPVAAAGQSRARRGVRIWSATAATPAAACATRGG